MRFIFWLCIIAAVFTAMLGSDMLLARPDEPLVGKSVIGLALIFAMWAGAANDE